MSLFSWLAPKRKPEPAPESSGMSRLESTRPYSPRQGMHGSHSGPNAQPANRKHERMHRRELLYAVVRDSMSRAGLLSTTYKFKVLSLDARGRQFLVMVDLAAEAGRETLHLAEIEAMIAQSGKTRHDILVTAVYWRMNDHVAVGMPAAARPMAAASHAPARAHEGPPSETFASTQPYESGPALQDEMALFRRALADGASGAEAMAAASAASGSAKHGPHSYTLLTGFEDTEMSDPDAPLSATQYGALR